MNRRYASTGAVAACAVVVVVGAPLAGAAPASDDRGFIDSTARCDAPDTTLVFGRTATSRVAVCEQPDGRFEYRGVRMRDGAKLITSARPSGSEGYVAESDGVSYTVTPDALMVAVGEKVVRDETMVEFEGPGVAPASPTPTTPLPPPLPAEVGG